MQYTSVPPEGRQGPGVLVLHAWWGLNETFRSVCDRLADDGFVGLAPDLFGDGRVVTTPADAEARVQSADWSAMEGRAEAGLDALLAHPALLGRQVGVVGFSLGAFNALGLSRRRPEIGAVVAYYGTNGGDFSGSHAAYLGHFVPGDEWEADEDVDALAAAIRSAGREFVLHRYPGTRHWFVEPDRPEYDPEAAALAWDRTIAFLRENLGPLGA